MHAALRAEGHGCSRGRVERLMRRHGIRPLRVAGSGPARPTVVTICRSRRTCLRSILSHPRRAGSDWPISPISPPATAMIMLRWRASPHIEGRACPPVPLGNAGGGATGTVRIHRRILQSALQALSSRVSQSRTGRTKHDGLTHVSEHRGKIT